jgi:phosphatidylserine/phosphatidylglycerophosphate/cardiolipin synthase-like enzyme
MLETKFLKTPELSLAILQLIDEAAQYCYLVTPYVKLWPQLERSLHKASTRGLFLTFIIREDPKSPELVKKLNGELGFEVYVIKDIHIKLFLNEERCFIASMNLFDASQTKNLEIGYFLQDSKNIVKDIIQNYILNDFTATHYPGRFEASRTLALQTVDDAKKTMAQKGYCVDCREEIENDFNRYRPYYVRCSSCYYLSDKDNPIKFCHYCGNPHESYANKPLHEECHDKLKELRTLLKGYA